MSNLIFVISTKEKSSRETRQRMDYYCGATYGDFSFVEMTRLRDKALRAYVKSALCA
ncbi:hypothetical protein SOM12_13240 [Flavobacterium sp. CFBP9031]|uniref:hypothetical protein n=1 Tax=unclassified Flavobacterium TaxID=196869 RepID=UPI00155481B0|nr:MULTISPECIES: hypothetical protein [unclassified Flavobacterium]MDY0988386.1 hypothetical protein [Flavobacterium sp. CFBP9031]